MPIRGIGGDGGANRWNLSARWVEGIPVDRAKLRLTATYAFTDDLRVGLEYNPLDDDLGLLANWRVWDETRLRPAFMLGTSSDRIGSSFGRAYFGTFSKDLQRTTGLAVAPYVGTAFGEFEDEWRFLAGLRVRWDPDWSSTHMWDGVNLHHLLDRAVGGRARLGLIVVEQEGDHYAGLTLGARL